MSELEEKLNAAQIAALLTALLDIQASKPDEASMKAYRAIKAHKASK